MVLCLPNCPESIICVHVSHIFGERFKIAKLAGCVLCLLSGVIRIEGELVGTRPEIVDVPSLRPTDTDERPGRDHLATTTQVRDRLTTTMFSMKLIRFLGCDNHFNLFVSVKY